jgi:endonuclease YncB( thermonuclease family)
MFQTLHKIYVAIGWAIALGVVALLIQHRAIFYPLVDLVDALRPAEGPEQQRCGELTGQVTRVLSGDMFDLMDDGGRFHRIRLTGVAAPEYQLTDRAEMRRAEQSQRGLGQVILSKRGRVELTFTNESGGGLGILYVGATNINALAVESRIARLKRDQMNGLPLKDRYALIQAARRAGEKKANEGG